MYTEVIKIIEGGLKEDSQKVFSYTRLLVENLKKDGEIKFANRIDKLLNNQKPNLVFQDQFMISPVDQESRMDMVDILMPSDEIMPLLLNDQLDFTIKNFIGTLKYKKQIQEAGIEVNSSLLLYGPPGCGKTSIAKHLANQLQLPLVIIRIDSLISSLLGNTAKNIRKIFDYANSKPCILFLDEFDAIAKARDDKQELGELKRVINSLLQNIDEYLQDNILIAATNHAELLDKAIWRRFNNIVKVDYPSVEEIHQLLILLFDSFSNDFLSNAKKMDTLAQNLVGNSHADIKTISNNSIINSIISANSTVSYEDLLTQIFLFKTFNNYNIPELVKYLNDRNVSQNSIAEYLKISVRQVINQLKL